MKDTSNQLDFDFSRPIDFQRNIDLEIINNCANDLVESRENHIFIKHLRLLLLELYFCWLESESQFLAVSMSKRGYFSKSRYNPNNISSYMIRTIDFLKKKKLIEFYSGFFDAKTKKSRLSRIKCSQLLKNHFKKIKPIEQKRFNHKNREYLLIYKDRNLNEYADSYETEEIRVILRKYNQLISQTLFDVPNIEQKFLVRADKKKIALSQFFSCTYSQDIENPKKGLIGGCWWNKLDLKLFLEIEKKVTINDKSTSYFNIFDYFGNYLSKIFDSDIPMQTRSFSKVLNHDQLCYLIIKSFQSRNYQSFISSVYKERKKLMLHDFARKEINDAIENLIIKNQKLYRFLFKSKQVGWEEFISKLFLELIGVLSPLNIPTYLVRSRIYFPTAMESIVLAEIEKILSKNLDNSISKLKSEKASIYNTENRNFFGKLVKSDLKSSYRYMNNKRYFGIEDKS